MSIRGAIVSYHQKKSNTSFVGSGICFNKKWILTHGNILSPLKTANDIIKHQPKKDKLKTINRYKNLPEMIITLEEETNEISFMNNIVTKKGRIVYLWKCSLLSEVLKKLVSNWKIGTANGNLEKQDNTGDDFFPVLILIHISDKFEAVNVEKCLMEIYDLCVKRSPIRGEELQLESTPFGNEVFINSKTNGLICNCLGPDDCLVLCDASSAIRSEGGPVFSSQNGEFFGMIVSSLSWWRGEWVGLTLVAFLTPILHKHLFSEPLSLKLFLTPKYLQISHLLDTIDSTVVRIRCGPSWGSGIVLDNGYILSCSHVVKNHNLFDIMLFCKGQKEKCKVIFRSSDDKAYDLALLHVSNNRLGLTPVKMSDRPAIKGETVVAIGYPYFEESDMTILKPTITKGQVSNVNPHALQTSCRIQSGYSGGAIMRFYKPSNINMVSHELLGIIVCNAKSPNTVFLNVNLSIPIHTIGKPLTDFINNNLQSLPELAGDTSKAVQSFWNMKFLRNKL